MFDGVDMRLDGEMQTAELLALYLALESKFESILYCLKQSWHLVDITYAT